MEFANHQQHADWLASQGALPAGFRVGLETFSFTAVENNSSGEMTMSLVALDRPSDAWAAMFTRNAFPGAPIILGRQRLAAGGSLGALVINNKISNVCAPEGVATASAVCAAVAQQLDLDEQQVLPSSTGIIGWQLPKNELLAAAPHAVQNLQADSIVPLATGIMTTDLYPKVRRHDFAGGGSIVAVAKGAGMVEPNLATMLVYILTDVTIARDDLQVALQQAVAGSFNAISIDTDQSTSDTVVAVSSCQAAPVDDDAFTAALSSVCQNLAYDLVRNGEGVHHVIEATVGGAPSTAIAKGVAKAVINSPLLQCAIAGNDPNVGRLVMAVGKHLGDHHSLLSTESVTMRIAGETVFAAGVFTLNPELEDRLNAALKDAELYSSAAPDSDGVFTPPVTFPPHERVVPITIDLGLGEASFTAIGGDRTHEYISENADYRS